jgi:predicted  nucleic acid-binding Zn-ribbon protein
MNAGIAELNINNAEKEDTVNEEVAAAKEVKTADNEVAAAKKKVETAEKKVETAEEDVAAAKKKVKSAEEKVETAEKDLAAAKKKVAAAKDATAKEEAEKGLAEAKWDLAEAKRVFAMAMRDLVALDPKAAGTTDWEAEVGRAASAVDARRDAYHKLVNPSAFSTSSVVATAGTLIDNVHGLVITFICCYVYHCLTVVSNL